MQNIPTKPTFICYKCGYNYYGSGHTCPKCYTDNKFPLLPFFCMVSIILMLFSISCIPLFCGLLAISLVTLPFSIKYVIQENKKTKDSFKIPDFPNEIINYVPIEYPEIIKTIYIDGLNFDKDIKNIIFSLKSNDFTINKDGMNEISKLTYDEIANMEILNDTVLEVSYGKSILLALVGNIVSPTIGIVSGLVGGFSTKDIYALLIEIKNEDNTTGKLLVGAKKQVIYNLYDKIYDKILISNKV